MLYNKPQLYLDSAIRLNDHFNSQFIQKVNEEDFRSKILENVFIASSEENPYHKEVKMNIALCKAMQEEKEKEHIARKRRQLRHETNHELIELRSQLQAAYLSKGLAAQKFEYKALKTHEQSVNHFKNDLLRKARVKIDEYDKRRVEEEQQRKTNLMRDLQEQMEITKAKRQQKKLELMREKERMDKAVRQYKEDEKRKRLEVVERKHKSKVEMETFLRAREEWRATHEIKALGEYEGFFNKPPIEKERKRRERQEQNYKISQEIGLRTHLVAEEKRRFEEFLIQLLINEAKAKDDLRHDQEKEYKTQKRDEVRQDLANYQEEKYHRNLALKKQKVEERRKGLLLEEEVKMQDKLMNEKTRMQIPEYQKSLLATVDEKRLLKAKEIKRNLIGNAAILENILRREKLDDLEWWRTLEEHLPTLKGYLPGKLKRQILNK